MGPARRRSTVRRGFRYPRTTTFHRFGEMGARRPFFMTREAVTNTYTRERQLQEQLTAKVEERIPGTEVLAVELLSPDRFCVFIDHPNGVDHALCERVTRELDEYRRDYTIDVSSPGPQRPLRKPEHFAEAVGRRGELPTAGEIAG